MKEYIVSVKDDERDFEEVFIAHIRKQTQLIRCKDCKHRDWDSIDAPYGQTKRVDWCNIRFNADGENVEVAPNDFCSKAERKEKCRGE